MCSCGKVIIGVGVFGVLLLIAGIVIGFSSVLDGYINNQIESSTRLENGTSQYERWENLPFPLQFKVYAFNVTNPAEILDDGAKPIVQEIGPFVYDQYRHKEDIQYDEEEDILTYRQYLSFDFNEELSAYGDDTELTVLNLPLMGIFLTVEGGSVLGTTNQMWERVFHGDGLFLKVSPKTFFFEGYQFCRADLLTGTTNIAPRLFCSTMKTLLADSKTMTSDSEKIQFAFFAHKDNNNDGEYKISAGNQDINTLGAILSWEGLEYLDTWNGDESTCNRIRGRDSSIYPPFNNDSSTFDIFNTDICRIVNLKTVGTTEYEGIDGIVAKLGIEDMQNDGDKSCYCIQQTKDLNGELECLPTGFADMYNCLSAPVITSFPHMLWADETYSNTVEGLEPDEDKHATFVAIEPDTGSPLQGAKRIQFNMIVRPIEGIDVTANISPTVFPVIWVEEGINLPEDQVNELKDRYLNKLRMLTAITWSLIGVGIGLIVICLIYFAVKNMC